MVFTVVRFLKSILKLLFLYFYRSKKSEVDNKENYIIINYNLSIDNQKLYKQLMENKIYKENKVSN